MSIEKMVGKPVISAKALTIGEVKGIEINTENWQVTHLHVKLTSEAATMLGFKKRFGSSVVCMPINFIKAVGDVITIDKSIEELIKSPEIFELKD